MNHSLTFDYVPVSAQLLTSGLHCRFCAHRSLCRDRAFVGPTRWARHSSSSPRDDRPIGSTSSPADEEPAAPSDTLTTMNETSVTVISVALLASWAVSFFGWVDWSDAAMTSTERRQGLGLELAEITWPGFKDDSKNNSDLDGFLKTRLRTSDGKTEKQKAAEAKAKLEKEKAEKAAEAKAKLEKEKAAAKVKADKVKADKEKAAAEAKAKAERERKERERRARERMSQQALLGGSAVGLGWYAFAKWNTLAALFASLFRAIGGPSLVSTLLRTPGYIVGRRVHLVEWNVEKSPDTPDGRVLTIRLRTQSPEGLKAAITKSYGLTGRNRVRQMSHWMTFGPGFFEPIHQASDFNCLPDPVWVVWSKERARGQSAIPFRSDEIAQKKPVAGSVEEMSALVTLIHTVAKLSRQSDQPPSQTFTSIDSESSDTPSSPSSLDTNKEPHHFPEEECPNLYSNRDAVDRVLEDALFSESNLSQGKKGKVSGLDGEMSLDSGKASNLERANSDVMDRLLDDICPDERMAAGLDESASSARSTPPVVEISGDSGENDSEVSSRVSNAGDTAKDGDTSSSARGVSDERGRRQKGLNLRPLKKSFVKFRDSIFPFAKWGGNSERESSTGSISSRDESEGSRSSNDPKGLDFLDGIVVSKLPPDFKAISEKEEIDLVLMAAERDPRFMELFSVLVLKDEDVWSFFLFARELTRRSRN